MKSITIFSLIFASLFLGGCNQLSPKSEASPVQPQTEITADEKTAAATSSGVVKLLKTIDKDFK
jgi:PBP1b-binding outer membrane lipoprotein LpoB